jgi:hypothetical protein
MRELLVSFSRAVLSQLHLRMLMLTIMPFVLSAVLWGIVLWLGFQPLIDWIQNYYVENGGFRIAGGVLGWLGMGTLKTVIAPLLAMWLLLPLMILTALLFIGIFAMPTIAKHVGKRHYPELEKRKGGNLWGSVGVSLFSFLIFLVLWVVTLPLSLMPHLGFLIHLVLWGWLTYRVMAYDAFSEYADRQERRSLMHMHRLPLLAIGIATGAIGAAPTLLWLGGALTVVFFPFLAGISIWLYVLVFVFSGLWFQHYCLAVLKSYRQREVTSVTPS